MKYLLHEILIFLPNIYHYIFIIYVYYQYFFHE